MEEVLGAYAAGLAVWMTVWGLNRIYLRLKSLVS